MKLAQLGFVTGQQESAPPELTIKPKGDLVDLLDKLKKLDMKKLANSMQQLGMWLSSLGNSGPFTGAMPLGGGSFGKFGDIGKEVEQALLEKFLEVQMLAATAPSGTIFGDATKFNLEVNGQSFPIVLDAPITSDNTSVAALAADLTAALGTALDNSDFDGAVVAVAVDGKLALRSKGTNVTSLRISNLDQVPVPPGVERLGFTDGQAVDDLRLQTLQELERMFEEALGLQPSEFDLRFNNQTNQILADVSIHRESLLDSSPIALPKSLGGLNIATSTSTIDLWRRVEADFTLGIDLNDVGQTYTFTPATPLADLPTWLTGIETGLLSTLPANNKGRLGKNVQFQLLLKKPNLLPDGSQETQTVTISLANDSTSSNNSLADLASDLNAALQVALPSALAGSVQASIRSSDGKLQLGITNSSVVDIEVRDLTNSSGDLSRLGFKDQQQFGRHLRIELSDGTSFYVNLAGVSTVSQMIERVQTASGVNANNQPRVTVAVSAEQTHLVVTENVSSSNAVEFSITSANGSKAGNILGILGSDDDDDHAIVDEYCRGHRCWTGFTWTHPMHNINPSFAPWFKR